MKNFFKFFLIGLFGGFIGAYFFISVNNHYQADIAKPILPTVSASPTIVPGLWENKVSEASLSLVAIQVLKDNKLIHHGSGLIISSDGLIVSSSDLAVSGAVYQVFYDDKIFKADVADVDYNSKILLLKTDSSYANVVDLRDISYHSGTEVMLIGKLIDFAKPVIFSQKGTISFITDNSVGIDTNLNSDLSGAGTLTQDGNFIGITFLKSGKVTLITSSLIENFFEQYITKQNKKQ